MTPRRRKQIIYEAMERIATGADWFACAAIDRAQGGRVFTELRTSFAEFYNQRVFGFWPILSDYVTEEAQNHRLMLLAWFAELGPEAVESIKQTKGKT